MLVGLAHAGPAQLVPLDPVEFQVNACTEGPQRDPALAAVPDGSFLVVWSSDADTSDNDLCEGIDVRRILGSGALAPGELEVNALTAGRQRRPRIGADGAGNFIVAWDSLGSFGNDSDMHSIQARRFLSGGSPLEVTEFQVNTLTEWIQKSPDIAVAPDGNFVIVWESWGTTGDDDWATSIQARRFRADGTPLDPVEFQVNTMTAGYQLRPRVASLPHGGFVVAWTTYDYFYFGVAARRFGASGAPLDLQEIEVNTWTVGDQEYPDVVAAADGSFIVVWESLGTFGDDDDLTSVQMRQYDRDGEPKQPAEVQVNTLSTGWQAIPTVTADPAGNFVVGWLDLPSAGENLGRLRRYSADGQPVDPVEFQSNALDRGWAPEIRLTREGDLGLVWSGLPPAGSDGSGIKARRFTRPTILVGGGQGPQGAGCTLVDAIAAANAGVPQGQCPAGSGGAIVTLPEDGLISLTSAVEGQSATPVVRTPIAIRGYGATVERDASLGCAGVDPFRLFEVADGGFLSIHDLHLRHGCVPTQAGGALLATGGAVRLAEVRISDGRAVDGGGVALAGASLVAVDSTFERNVASGRGGGLAALDGLSRLTLDRTTLAHNSASTGGGVSLASGAALDLFHGTLSVNVATMNGGGLAIEGAAGDVALLHSTIAGNSAPLASALGWEIGTLAIHDSLVGDGTGGAACASTAGTLEASGHNLATDGSCAALAGGPISEVGKLGLTPLRDHGGLVATQLPLAGSPALDAAPACASPTGRLLSEDARGYPRPTDDDGDGEALCDLGAVERGPLFLDGFESGDARRWAFAFPVSQPDP
jgi:hypothetical protein